jgi:multiple sugar transport system ATP-binding protein
MDRPKAMLGLRPEHLTILDDAIDGATFPATVEIDEPMGADSLVWLEAEGKQISVRVPFEHRPKAGARVHLKVDIAKASLFDETNEQRI